MFRKIFSFFLAFLIFFSCNISSFASVTVDGKPNNSEWEDSSLYLFENPKSFNNSVEQAFLKVIPDFSQNKLFLCINMNLKSFDDFSLSGVKLRFDENESVILKGNGESEYDADIYEVNYGVSYDVNSKNLTYEISVGFKMGLKIISKLEVVLTDTQNHPSNRFDFLFDFSDSETTVSLINQRVTDLTKKTSSSKTKKTKSTTTDDFTFKKVENKGEITSESSFGNTTAIVYLSDNAVDNKSRKEKIYIVSGVVGSLAVIMAGVYRNIRKNKQADKD